MSAPVLVTELEFRKAEALFVATGCEPAPAEEQALADAVKARGARVVIVGVAPYHGPLYAALGRQGGGLIARFGVGHDNILKPLARDHGIVVTNTPGTLDQSVAEHAICLLGCLARRISRLEARLRGGDFSVETGMELSGKTLGILGFGPIGRRAAVIGHFGFGMQVVACDRVAPPAPPATYGADRFTSDAEELFRAADVVSVHLPATAETRRFVNAARLAWLKPGALIVNTARGAVLDEDALFDALVSHRLAGAALDVFENEPYRPVTPGKDLRTLDSVVLTPHVSSNTREANQRMAELCLQNVRHFFAGELEQLTRVGIGP